ncbi:M15 family metallopeptidase [Sediminibacillus massiliensis]|uniref:M15 family metallopeptidase n=1 Tax=Sediminibacillus massiliensis TaxID=1926277 RepID=UPI000988326A|nr:M15 family metallopeptidase [Sediminibacillus massiliensis]
MKFKFLLSISVLAVALIGCQEEPAGTDNASQENAQEQESDEQTSGQESSGEERKTDGNEETESEAGQPSEEEPALETGTVSDPVTVDNPKSLDVLVNKQRKLPDGYEPPDLVEPDVPFYFDEEHEKRHLRKEAATALEELFDAAEGAGLDIVAASGYRSYERQKVIYQSNVDKMGQEKADKLSARPGTSEHQTGLAMDVTSAEMAFSLQQTFKQTDEGSWLAENAHKFGFIIRYPEGKTDITGYSYEPWHIRYVGEEIATEIYQKNITLEEYFNV